MIDRKDWDMPYFNQAFWLFENLEHFQLEPNEALVALVISYLNQTNQAVNYDKLIEKCHMDADEVEECFESLTSKGYLTIDAKNKSLHFLLEGFLDSPIKVGRPISKPLLVEFQEEFNRPFSPGEMERIMDMGQTYEEGMVLQALNEAALYDKRNLNYIENILINWVKKGLSTEDVENGKR